MTKRDRCLGIACVIGGQMATMLAAAVVLMTVGEAFHWGAMWIDSRRRG